jgi:MFS family permease
MEATTDFSERKRHRVAITVFFFIAGFTFASWASRIPQIQAKLQMNDAVLGAVLFALPIGLMVSLLLSGWLIARFGSKKVLLISACFYSCILLFLGLSVSVWQLAATLFLFGVASSLFNTSVNTQAVGVEKMYGRSIMASFHGVWSLAGFSGAAVGALMVSFQIIPWIHFILIGITGLFLTALFTAKTMDTKPAGDAAKTVFVLPDKHILQLGLIAFGSLFCEGTMFDWSGVYFKKAVLVPPQLTALGYTAFMGSMAAGRFIADSAVMKFGAKKMLIFSGLIIFSGLMIAVIFPTIITATLGFIMVGFGVSSVVPLVYSKAGQSATMPPGKAIAAISTVGFAGFLAGPPLIGFMAEVTSLRLSFALVACIGLSISLLAKRNL